MNQCDMFTITAVIMIDRIITRLMTCFNHRQTELWPSLISKYAGSDVSDSRFTYPLVFLFVFAKFCDEIRKYRDEIGAKYDFRTKLVLRTIFR